MSRMGEWVAENPPPDTDLEDCDYAQFERELLADPAYQFWAAQLDTQRKETKHGDQRN